MAHIGRAVKNVEVPRPLKSQSRSSLKNNYMLIEELIQLIETVAINLQSGYNSAEPMAALVQNLRVHGPQLETASKDTLDRAFVVFRNASQDERLNIMTRLNLLELIELRAKGWEDTGLNSYYKSKQVNNTEHTADLQHIEANPSFLSTSPTFGNAGILSSVGSPQQQHLLLGPGEVIRNSGKFLKPTKIPGKTYCKDEVIIRNADSGKVMGIKGRRVHMIEEFSETIISFQRVNPGAKERLVQITGPTEEKINYAKHLIEDTIRRNASPVRHESNLGANATHGSCSSLASSNNSDEVQLRSHPTSNLANRLSFNSGQNFMTGQQAAALSQQQQQLLSTVGMSPVAHIRPNPPVLLHSYSTNDASLGEYKYTVNVGQHMIKITGECCELVRVAKLVLDDYFSSAEFLASVELGAAFEGAVTSPITTPIGPPHFIPASPTTAMPAAADADSMNYMTRKQSSTVDDEVFIDDNSTAAINSKLARSRRSHFSRRDSLPEVSSKETARIVHEYDCLLFYSKSPHAWVLPDNWKLICEKFPSIIRNKDLEDEANRFDGEKYLELVRSSSKRIISVGDDTNDTDILENE